LDDNAQQFATKVEGWVAKHRKQSKIARTERKR
jgi:hypothetical protein